jgi:8-oxo-dGTP diphosphatase
MTRSHHTREHDAMAIAVVGAALVRAGRVLAARRARPAKLAGGWEFPGGKVEHGESDVAALSRELREELGIGVVVGSRLGDATDGTVRLTLYAATICTAEPEPVQDHDELRWLAATELGEVNWLPIDRALLPLVASLLNDQPAIEGG